MSDAPASPEPLVCPRCLPLERNLAEREEALRVLSAELEERAIEVAGLQRKVLEQIRREDDLTRKIDALTERGKTNPKRKQNQDVKTILETHRRLTAVQRKKRDEPVDLDSDDAHLVRKQLKRYSAMDLLEAIQGKALRPWFRDYNHHPKPPGKRQVTMRHCIGTDEWIERNREWWHAAQEAALSETERMFRAWAEISLLHTHWEGLVLGAIVRREWYEMDDAKRNELAELWREVADARSASPEPAFLGAPKPEPLAKVIPINREAA